MILDTSFVVDVLRGDDRAVDLLADLESGSEALRVPSLVHYELWEGIERTDRPVREFEAVTKVLASYPSAELGPGAAVAAGRVSARLIRTGEMLDDVDVLLAGIALDRDEALVTRDADDFERIPDLEVVTY